jgi:hypothetical protein
MRVLGPGRARGGSVVCARDAARVRTLRPRMWRPRRPPRTRSWSAPPRRAPAAPTPPPAARARPGARRRRRAGRHVRRARPARGARSRLPLRASEHEEATGAHTHAHGGQACPARPPAARRAAARAAAPRRVRPRARRTAGRKRHLGPGQQQPFSPLAHTQRSCWGPAARRTACAAPRAARAAARTRRGAAGEQEAGGGRRRRRRKCGTTAAAAQSRSASSRQRSGESPPEKAETFLMGPLRRHSRPRAARRRARGRRAAW